MISEALPRMTATGTASSSFPHAHRVQKDRDAHFPRPGPRRQHGAGAAAMQRPQVEIQAAADGGNLRYLLHIIGHDRRSAAGKQEIGAIAGRHIIGNAVDQGRLALHLAQQFPQGQRTIYRWSLPPFPEFHGRTSS